MKYLEFHDSTISSISITSDNIILFLEPALLHEEEDDEGDYGSCSLVLQGDNSINKRINVPFDIYSGSIVISTKEYSDLLPLNFNEDGEATLEITGTGSDDVFTTIQLTSKRVYIKA